jgi:hypothetical protein
MSEDRKRVLEMLAAGKVTVDEAERLLAALAEAPPEADAAAAPRKGGYIRVTVRKKGKEAKEGADKYVGIRVPFSLVKGGMRLGAMIPGCGEAVTEHLKKKGIDFDVTKMDPDAVEAALRDLGEMEIDDGKSNVRITYE